MLVSVNMSREVYEYYKDYDLSAVVDTMLEIFDITVLPPVVGRREVERQVNVSDPAYIDLYNTLGPRNKKVSLARLLEFGYNTQVLSYERFNNMKLDRKPDNPTHRLIDRAYRALLNAQKYDNSVELKTITSLVYDYREVVKNG